MVDPEADRAAAVRAFNEECKLAMSCEVSMPSEDKEQLSIAVRRVLPWLSPEIAEKSHVLGPQVLAGLPLLSYLGLYLLFGFLQLFKFAVTHSKDESP